ncbi:SusD/RagB family nutrient-binding outer membrane lipoprotein [Labilibaculum sp.]|uniref:SusD/RagB family nutrient-binding outer membrane lipoprotein n=1 Tax=Labilibaculum sp. TaxID=2060723 RepID=UPI003567D7E4
MKKYIFKIAVFLSAITITSCSDEVMDEINENVNNPSDVTSNLIITDVMTSSAFSVTASDLAFYASCYMEHNVGVYGQMYNAETRSGEPTSSSTYNNSWDAIYTNLYNLKDIIEKCDEGGSEEGNYYTLGIAQILSAYNLAILTDLFGDVPWSEALQPGVIFTPVLDSQESIYEDIFAFLDNGIANLSEESVYSLLGSQDFLYDGDDDSIEKWQKFAYGLKARYTMRLSYISPDYDSVIAYADQSFTDASEQCQFDYNGTTSKSPFYQFFLDRDYFGSSQSLHDKMESRNDPRDSVYFVAYEDSDELIFAPNGEPEQIQEYYGMSGISEITAPTYLMSYHELEFLKAEAYARNGDLDGAKTALENAIIAACAKTNVDVSEADATAYYDAEIAPKLTDADAALREIMVQKYIAFYEEEAVEAYNDYRRLTAMGNNFIDLDNSLNSSKFPLRFTYGSEDVTTNANVYDAYGDGTYVYSENVWWAGGSR